MGQLKNYFLFYLVLATFCNFFFQTIAVLYLFLVIFVQFVMCIYIFPLFFCTTAPHKSGERTVLYARFYDTWREMMSHRFTTSFLPTTTDQKCQKRVAYTNEPSPGCHSTLGGSASPVLARLEPLIVRLRWGLGRPHRVLPP